MNRLCSLLCAAALALGCRSAPAPKPAAAEGLPAAEYAPLALGNAWTYAVSAGGEQREETIRMVGRDGPWFLDDHRARFRLDAEGLRDRDRYLLRSPVHAGATWTAVESLAVEHFRLEQADATVTVPAGTFAGCAIVRNEQPVGKGDRFVTEWTWAPHVGLVELRTFAVGPAGREREQTHLRLVRYTLR